MERDKRIGLALREPVPWPVLLGLVETAEQTGYEAVFVPEIVWREAFSTLAGFAAVTSRLRLGTGVVPAGSRDALTAALGAVTVQEISQGRMILGLGAGRAGVRAARTFLTDVRALLEGQAAGRPPRRLELATPRVPVWMAALGPRMVELAGEMADGVLLNWCPPERVLRARRELARGAERAGRDPSAVTVAVYVRACLGHEEGLSLAALRIQAGEYAGMPAYARQLRGMGLGEEAAAAAKALAAGEVESVPETLVRATCVLGDRATALARLHEYREAGADLVIVYPVPALDPSSSIMGTLLALAPSPAVER